MKTGKELSAIAFGSRRVDMPEDREAWLKLREQGIGASEAGAICGASRFASPYSVWLEKIDGKDDWADEQSEMQAAGHRHEPTIAKWFMEQDVPGLGNYVLHDPGDFTMVWANDTPAPIFATLDRLLTNFDGDPKAPLEMKCAWGPSGKEWESKVPLSHQIQTHVQMIATNTRHAYIAVLIDGYKFRWYRLDYNPKFAEALVRKLTRFWQKYVITREPPPVDFSKATTDALASQWIPPTPTTIDLPAEAQDWTNERAAIAARIKAEKRRDDLLANQLRQAIGPNEIGVLPDGKTGWSWKANKKSRILRQCKVKHVIGVN